VKGQRGMTLVELVVAMSAMAILLLGIGSVLYVGYHAASLWGQRITQAETLNQVAGALGQDVHVDVPCGGQPAGGQVLDLCPPSSPATGPSYSAVPAGGGWNIVRKEPSAGAAIVLARGLVQAPQFFARCSQAANVDTGYVGVRGLHYPEPAVAPGQAAGVTSPPPLVVYFRAPRGSCGGSGG
jgi:prepilin-type N-terminal cleavage/methylation domain-containing protein